VVTPMVSTDNFITQYMHQPTWCCVCVSVCVYVH
jgi:hypothetical protein